MSGYLLYALVFAALVGAVAAAFGLDRALRDALHNRKQRQTKIRSYRAPSRLQRAMARLKTRNRALLRDSAVPVRLYRIALALCIVVGVGLGYAVFRSIMLAVAVGLMSALIPFAYLSYRSTVVKKSWLERLNADMLTVSNSYLVTNDLIRSVQECVGILEYPEPFRAFLAYVTLMDSDVISGLRRMENDVNEAYFSQWIDALVLAQKDRSLADVTVAIVDSMRDILIAQRESDAQMSEIWREYLIELVIIFLSPLLLRAVMPMAYEVIVASAIGQLLFFLLLVALAFSAVMALRINRSLVK